MPTAQQQQHKALSQFFLTAGPQLLLDALAWERANAGLDKINYLGGLAIGLQMGVEESFFSRRWFRC